MSQYVAYAVLALVAGALYCTLAGWLERRWCFTVSLLAAGASVLSSVVCLALVVGQGPFSYTMGGWSAPWGIEFRVDWLSAPMMVLVSLVALLNLPTARRMAEGRSDFQRAVFYTLYLLCAAGHLGIVVTADVFNLYVLIEISALTGYALLSFGTTRATLSSFNYLIIGSVGASFYLLGIGFLYMLTGTLNMTGLAGHLAVLSMNNSVVVAFGILLVGLFIKMAFFPLHVWMPNAYSHASPAAAGLLAPLTTKVMIYVVVRVGVSVFPPRFAFNLPHISELVLWLAVTAILCGAGMALAQRSLVRMVTYIMVSEVGYMMGGLFLGNRVGALGTLYHIFADSLMTLCLFLAASNIVYRTGSDRFESFRGLFSAMPFTMGCFAVAALSMIGVPPTAGFFGKWYFLQGAIADGHWIYGTALILSSLVNVVLFFRIFEIAFFQPVPEGRRAVVIEAPPDMVAPLILTATSIVALGLGTGPFSEILLRLFPQTFR